MPVVRKRPAAWVFTTPFGGDFGLTFRAAALFLPLCVAGRVVAFFRGDVGLGVPRPLGCFALEAPLLSTFRAAFALRVETRFETSCAANARLRARLNARFASLTALRATFNRALARLNRRLAIRALDRAETSNFVATFVTPIDSKVTSGFCFCLGFRGREASLGIVARQQPVNCEFEAMRSDHSPERNESWRLPEPRENRRLAGL